MATPEWAQTIFFEDMEMPAPNALEMAVLSKLLDGDTEIFVALRKQLDVVQVVSREETGVGFYTELASDEYVAAAVMRAGRVIWGDVHASIPALAHGAGFLVYVVDGRLRMLEGYAFDEAWPGTISQFVLSYTNPNREAVVRQLAEP